MEVKAVESHMQSAKHKASTSSCQQTPGISQFYCRLHHTSTPTPVIHNQDCSTTSPDDFWLYVYIESRSTVVTEHRNKTPVLQIPEPNNAAERRAYMPFMAGIHLLDWSGIVIVN
eukprot:superscaffoldBa00001829_g12197